MTDSASGPRPRRLTARGAATKARIIEAADQLMYERGSSPWKWMLLFLSSGLWRVELVECEGRALFEFGVSAGADFESA